MTMAALEFLRDTLRLMGGKAQYYLVDERNSELFPMNERLWDVEKDEWRFDKEAILAEFRRRIAPR
jgi:hypothetical protein